MTSGLQWPPLRAHFCFSTLQNFGISSKFCLIFFVSFFVCSLGGNKDYMGKTLQKANIVDRLNDVPQCSLTGFNPTFLKCFLVSCFVFLFCFRGGLFTDGMNFWMST